MASLVTISAFLLLASQTITVDVGTYNYSSAPTLSLTSSSLSLFNTTANTTDTQHFSSLIFSAPISSYTIKLGISEHSLPATSSSSTQVETKSLIFLTPPSAGQANTTSISQQQACLLIFKRVSANATKNGQNDDGGCHPALGKACVEALQTAVSEAGNPNDGTGAGISFMSCGSLLSEIPEECSGAIDGGQEDIISITVNPSNVSLPLLQVSSETHDVLNTSYYAEATSRIWPVLFFEKFTEPIENGNGSHGSSSTQTVCLRARDVKQPESSGTSTGPNMSQTSKPGVAGRFEVRGWKIGALALALGFMAVS